MEYRRLGQTELKVSVVALGCWPIAGRGLFQAVCPVQGLNCDKFQEAAATDFDAECLTDHFWLSCSGCQRPGTISGL